MKCRSAGSCEEMVCINIMLMHRWGFLHRFHVTDLSSLEARKRFFCRRLDDYGEKVRGTFTVMNNLAQLSKEVMLRWRGNLPLWAFDTHVHDPCFG